MVDASGPVTINVDEAFLARVLAPYKPHCRYLESAVVEHGADALCSIRGRFGIPASCYIDDTGHLNSVEVNICYNQMLYTLYATGVVHGFIPPLASLSLDEYLARQLPDVLIHKIDMAFKRPIDPRAFDGEMSFEDALDKGAYVLFPSRYAFTDASGGRAVGKVSVVFDNRGTGRVAGHETRAAEQGDE